MGGTSMSELERYCGVDDAAESVRKIFAVADPKDVARLLQCCGVKVTDALLYRLNAIDNQLKGKPCSQP